MKTAFFPILLTLAAIATAAPLKIELPPETPKIKDGPGATAIMANCLICHSTEYITTQPALPPAAWKAIVEKMQKKYGAPLPPDQVETVVEYLAKSYGAPAPAAAAK